ncbi:uncharacterized protein C8A04DRAFT_40967 [Dichotomopilus funicola]|uniref:Uncharacterized protein n=1 Tax=Dichotomopilus funicola TaxID=1934379 RepID=A0AAN6ZHA1_9PEZI|nr:hypothetical protein C8A04DRAFT_40967 [Dichotomopilus funicola]
MSLSTSPEPNAWARLDTRLVGILDKLCRAEYDSEADSIPICPRPSREALEACHVTVNSPRCPSAFAWAAVFCRAAHSALKDQQATAPLLCGRDPREDCLAGPSFHESGHISWAGETMIEHTATNWGCMLADQTAPVDARPNRGPADKYVLRSELLACVCPMRLQINETPVDGYEFTGWKLRVGNSIVKSTVICFEDTRVRVIQASYDPSLATPALVATLRGSYPLPAVPVATCSKDTVWPILWWILNPDGPSDSLTGLSCLRGVQYALAPQA